MLSTALRKLIWLYAAQQRQGGGGTEQTVTGPLPLTLANALSHAIVSLTRYGLCVQDGTDILCNNGALRMVDDELPTGYKRLLGIAFDGEVYYVTNYHMRGADALRFSFKAAATGRNVIGCYSGTDATDNLSFYFSTGSTGVYLRYNGGLYRPVAWTNTVYNCVISPTGVTGLSTDVSWTEADFTSAAALFIGWLDNATSPKFLGDMYGSIVVDGRANIIPVERQSDGAIGYWDGQAFLENQGTGTPVSLGYDASHYHLSVDGTPEVLTISGANLLDPSPVTDDNKYIHSQNGSPTAPSATGGVFRYSGFIPVKAGIKYFFGMTPYTAAAAGLAWYSDTSAASYISGVSGSTLRNVNNMMATAPAGALYLRFGWRIDEGYDTDWQHSVYVCACDSNSDPIISAWQAYVQPQTVSNIPNLFSTLDGSVRDEVDFVSGVVTRRTEAVYENGGIVIYPLAESTTEQTTAQHLSTHGGTNIVDSVANVGPVEAEVEYYAAS